jgi:hypothetical protein
VDTSCIIKNEQGIADHSSRMDLLYNEDRSVDINVGPDAPTAKSETGFPLLEAKPGFPIFDCTHRSRHFSINPGFCRILRNHIEYQTG